ncbi:hypothetical protein DV092_04500 [Clostridium botulinum]|nr:hypothetical protein [Clostridium botulinum]
MMIEEEHLLGQVLFKATLEPLLKIVQVFLSVHLSRVDCGGANEKRKEMVAVRIGKGGFSFAELCKHMLKYK